MFEILWIVIPVIIGVAIFLVYWFYLRNNEKRQGWDCVEGDCEKVLGGEYKTYEQCKNRCADNYGKEGYGSCSSGTKDKVKDKEDTVKKVRFMEEGGVTRVDQI